MHEVAGTIMRARMIGKGRRKKKIAEVTTYPSRFAMYDTPFFFPVTASDIYLDPPLY